MRGDDRKISQLCHLLKGLSRSVRKVDDNAEPFTFGNELSAELGKSVFGVVCTACTVVALPHKGEKAHSAAIKLEKSGDVAAQKIGSLDGKDDLQLFVAEKILLFGAQTNISAVFFYFSSRFVTVGKKSM